VMAGAHKVMARISLGIMLLLASNYIQLFTGQNMFLYKSRKFIMFSLRSNVTVLFNLR